VMILLATKLGATCCHRSSGCNMSYGSHIRTNRSELVTILRRSECTRSCAPRSSSPERVQQQ
jgi:hypothetical protein